MQLPDSSSEEQTAPVLSVREEWLLFCWMAKHPRAILEDTTTHQATGERRQATAGRQPSVAYALGLAVGTLWLLLKRSR